MFTPAAVILTVILYMLFLFGIAQFVEKKITSTGTVLKSPWIYALSIAVFHTSWTFYGSVGFAAKNGLLFLGIYIGALIGICFWWVILRKMVAAKETFRITSIADFISTRYRRSQKIAGLVTIIALIGLLPYIALQLKAINSSFDLITSSSGQTWEQSSLVVTLLMTAFTIIFGVRRLDPTERHQGMIVALVVESLVKLIAFAAVGLFVCFYLYDGLLDINQKIMTSDLSYLISMDSHENSSSMWITLLVLSFAAIYLLPRQFHVSVIENTDQRHIKTAMWLFPLYVIAINLFVIPIAAAGIMQGLPLDSADFFVLLLPQASDQTGLTLFAFIGGFSAATGMVIITTMTLSTMVSNHLLLPLIEKIPAVQPLRTRLLQLRWVLVALILAGSYGFESEFSDSYILAAIGLLSFVAILQFAPVVFGGIFWGKGNSGGAFAGLLAGFLVWCYTLLLPTFIKQGWLNEAILLQGPWSVELLRPEALLGLDGLNPITHSVIWTMVFNISFYILGSLIYHPHKAERTLTNEFFAAMLPASSSNKARPTGLDTYITLNLKLEEAQTLLSQYLSPEKAKDAVYTIAEDLQVIGKSHITIVELMEFHRMIEHVLAGSIGAASAHNAMEQSIRYSDREANDLKALYSHISELGSQVSPTQEESATESLPNGFGMLADLQSQIDNLEEIVTAQRKDISTLETKLDQRYEEIFKYRVTSQRIAQENMDLREQLNKLTQQNKNTSESGGFD